MNNKELIGELARRLGYTNKDTSVLVNSVIAIMGEQLQENKTLSIQGFGSFEVRKKMERIIVNPSTKQRFLVPPKLVLAFKPVMSLRDKFKNISDE